MLTVEEYKIKVKSTCKLKFVINAQPYSISYDFNHFPVSKTIAVNFHIIVK